MTPTKIKLILAMALLLLAAPLKAQQAEKGPAVLTWPEAVRILNEANPQKIQSRQQIAIYEQKVLTAEGGLFPQLLAQGDYSKTNPSSGLDESYSYGLSASQVLFGPEITAGLRKSKADLQKVRAEDNLLDANLLFELRQLFAQMVFAQDAVKLSEEIVKRRKDNLELIRLRYRAGRESHAALLETQSLLSLAVWEHSRDRKNLTLAQRKINRLLGRPLVLAVQVEQSFPLREPPQDFLSFPPLLARHPKILSLDAARLAAEADKAAARSSFLPTANASANYSWNGYNWPDNDKNWNYGLNLNWSLFSGGGDKAKVRAGELTVAQAEVETRKTADELYVAAEEAFLSWKESFAYIDVIRDSLEASGERSWLVHNQYLSGQAGYFEWRDVENQLVNYQNKMLSAKLDLAVTYSAFLKSLGTGEYPL